MTTAMEIDTPVANDDTSDATFTLESLSEPLLSFAKEAVAKKTENSSTIYDTLETQLRDHLLKLVSSSSSQESNASSKVLHDEWTACWKLCIYLLQECPDLDRFIRKLPFVLLEDLVECLPLGMLQEFWMSLDTTALCSGALWQQTCVKNTSHILQYIRLQNALLKRISPNNTQLAGTVLMDMAKTLALSDRSALKLWGSVSGRMTEYDEEQEGITLEKEDALNTKEAQEAAHSFHQVFWSVQQDMHNPYSISFANFFQNVKQILAALESKTIVSSSMDSGKTNKYLTKSRLLPLQLQDATFVQYWLTQLLIIESFVSSQSPKLKTTLSGVSNRAKALLRKLPNGTVYLQRLQSILNNSEDIWRQWKRNKCKPDMEVVDKKNDDDAVAMDTTKEDATHQETTPLTTLEDLQETARTTMAIPSLETHLEDYVDALDPEAGIEAEYHPRNDKLYCWRSLRLLGRQHLDYFGQIRRSDGDFEGMVRDVYKQERNVDIPGERPEQEVVKDYDEDIGSDVKETVDKKEAKDKTTPAVVVDEDEIMIDTPQEPEVPSDAKQAAVAKKEEEDKVEDSDKATDGTVEKSSDGEDASPDELKAKDEASDDKDVPKAQETDKKEEPKEESKPPPTKPSKPLTAFEKAALEEEELLIAEHKEKEAKQEEEKEAAATKGTFAAMASEAEQAKPAAAKAKPMEETQKKKETKKATTTTRKEATKQTDDRKRKHESTFSSMAGNDAATTNTKRPRGNQGRSANDQAAPQRRSDTRGGPTRGGGQHDDRSRGNWSGGRGGRGGGGRGPPNPPPRRTPPAPSQQEQQHQRPGRGGGRGGDGVGRGRGGPPVAGRGGRGGQRRDGRRRY